VGLYEGVICMSIDWFDTTLHAALCELRKAVGWPAVSKWNQSKGSGTTVSPF